MLQIIAANRSPDSYVAGATVIHAEDDSARNSDDLDLFSDYESARALEASAIADERSLREAGFSLVWEIQVPAFFRAVVTRDGLSLKLEWVGDSAFRFFPLERDPILGYRLHHLDAATNKVLALAGRNEIRDLIDCLFLHQRMLSLGALAWAACGKDKGYTPDLILNEASRKGKFRDEELRTLNLVTPLKATEIKREWLQALAAAHALCDSLPAEELGCLYLDDEGKAVTPDPAAPGFSRLRRHYGSVRGAWPRLDEGK